MTDRIEKAEWDGMGARLERKKLLSDAEGVIVDAAKAWVHRWLRLDDDAMKRAVTELEQPLGGRAKSDKTVALASALAEVRELVKEARAFSVRALSTALAAEALAEALENEMEKNEKDHANDGVIGAGS